MDIFIGNTAIRRLVAIAVASAKLRNSAPPHMLFSGAPGCGKTTMANRLATYIESKFIQVEAATIKTYKDVKSLIAQLSTEGYNATGEKIGPIKPSILFLDEIHNLPLRGQELLGLAMENFILPVPAIGPVKREALVKRIPEFVLVGATTNDGKLSKPFRDRFELKFLFSTYTYNESKEIIKVHAKKLGIKITEKAVEKIAQKGRGVPRILVGYLKGCRDMALSLNRDLVEDFIVDANFKYKGINEEGFTASDLKLLGSLFNAEIPVGLQNLSIILNESPGTIESSIEPYLIQTGLMARGPRGREITVQGIKYLSERGYVNSEDAMRLLIERS